MTGPPVPPAPRGPRPTEATQPPTPGPTDRHGDLEPDVEQLHRAIAREPRDPGEGREPVPLWLWAAVALALFWGGWYLGRFGGTFGAATHVALARPDAEIASATRASASPEPDPAAAGKRTFMSNCQPCHQPTGRGVPGVFPPLVGSEWVVGAPDILARIVLNGLQGPVTVAGATYDGVMPAWRDQLSNEEIAAVLTYLRQWAPNRAMAVSPTLVATARSATASRAGPWTVGDLRRAAVPSTLVPPERKP